MRESTERIYTAISKRLDVLQELGLTVFEVEEICTSLLDAIRESNQEAKLSTKFLKGKYIWSLTSREWSL